VDLGIVLYGAEKVALDRKQGCFPYAIPPYMRYGATHTEPLTRKQALSPTLFMEEAGEKNLSVTGSYHVTDPCQVKFSVYRGLQLAITAAN